jgi:hypothetical protein
VATVGEESERKVTVVKIVEAKVVALVWSKKVRLSPLEAVRSKIDIY